MHAPGAVLDEEQLVQAVRVPNLIVSSGAKDQVSGCDRVIGTHRACYGTTITLTPTAS